MEPIQIVLNVFLVMEAVMIVILCLEIKKLRNIIKESDGE